MDFAEGFTEVDEPVPPTRASNGDVAAEQQRTKADPANGTAQFAKDSNISSSSRARFSPSSTTAEHRSATASADSAGSSAGKLPAIGKQTPRRDDEDIVVTGYRAPAPREVRERSLVAAGYPHISGATAPSYPSIPAQAGRHGSQVSNIHSPLPMDQYARYAHHLQARPNHVYNTHLPQQSPSFGRIPMVSGSNIQHGSHQSSPSWSSGAYNNAYRSPECLPSSSSNPPRTSSYSSIPAHTSRDDKPKLTSSSSVIDLTEGDDGDSIDSEEVTVKAEKMPVKPEDDDDDGDLQIVGEKQNEATAPVCIGQLTGVALILYPIAELAPPMPGKDANGQPVLAQPLPLRTLMNRSQQQWQNGMANETIKLYSAATKENFGVLEHRLANVLGPVMTKDNRRGRGVWMEAWVLRTRERSPMMLQMLMLLFCHPQILPHVANQLEKCAIYLQHPQTYDPAMHNGFKYHNPHGPMYQSAEAERRKREVMNGLGGNYASRYASQPHKSIEVQREQVEQMFTSMKSGADLGEIEPDAMLTTKMYPHQKQALAFLMDRERWRDMDRLTVKRKELTQELEQEDEENMIALWRPKRDMYGRFVGWQNAVTEVEIGSDRPPPQCRGAILADDMGLGKTIVILALVATTLSEAKVFATHTPTKDRLGASFDAIAAHPAVKQSGNMSVASSGFSTPIFGKANGLSTQAVISGSNGTNKKKGENKTQKKREELEASRIKMLRTRSRGTLIVCPLSTVVNWESQIDEHIGIASNGIAKRKRGDKSRTATPVPPSGLSIYIYHGNNRTSDIEALANHDIVITTFSTLGSEYSRQRRKEEQDEAGSSSSDGGIEEVDARGELIPAKSKKRKRKKIEGDAISPLQQIEWFRIVLDEAHMIKEHTTIQARACCDLMAERRICLTGTPLQNSLNDLFSLMRFLRLEPFTDRSIWTAYIGAPAKVGDPLGVSRLQLLMRHTALRRTKNSTDKEGKPILSIPPKKDEIRYLQLDEQEKAFYSAHHRRYKHNFEMLEKSDSLLKNYCSILQEVLRLRQICAHMALVRDSEDRASLAKGEDGGDVVSAIKAHGLSKSRALRLLALMRDTGAAQCGECGFELAASGLNNAQDADEEEACVNKKKRKAKISKKEPEADGEDNVNPSAPLPVITRCQHLFCIDCFVKNVCPTYPDVNASDRSICTLCREEISPIIDAVQISSSDIDILAAGDSDDEDASQLRRHSDRVVEHSTKIRTLMSDLFPLSQNNPNSVNYAGGTVDLDAVEADEAFRPERDDPVKTVVFSQWTKLLDRCEDALQECHIKYTRLDGGMNRNERTKALATFKNDLACEVMLISLRAGGVGLNLTHASRVYILDPNWNPQAESQALDRVHRLGQTRPVKATRLIMKDSIEDNMLTIQKRKLELANLSLSQTLTKAQLAERRLEDLRTLFR